MTKKDLRKIIKRNSAVETISTETGLRAGLQVAAVAESENLAWAFAGGIAMHIYGFVRATTDVDLIGSETLPLESHKTLSFGGESYRAKVDNQLVIVDWIVRGDKLKKFYEKALDDAIEIDGISIVTPEWLAILKHLSGRPKDQIDLIWLLQQDDLVDRELIESHVKEVLGEYALYLLNDLQSEFDYADVLKLRGERNKYD